MLISSIVANLNKMEVTLTEPIFPPIRRISSNGYTSVMVNMGLLRSSKYR